MIQTRIETVSILSQLNDELVIDYDTGSAGKTITQIVTDLLALQVSTNPITIGTIQPTVSRAIRVQGDTILGALLKLRDTVGGYVSVDNGYKLNWMDNIGEDKGQQIRYRKNLIGITRTMDFANFGNRLYCYGAGEGDARIKLSDAEGQVEDYVEDAESQAIYGIIVRQLVDKSITHPDTLLAWANLKLAELKTPFISYRIDMVDLSERDVGFSFDALQLGSVVEVIDEDLGINVEARIVKIRHRNLYDPEDIEIEISNHTKDVIDLLSEVYDRQQLDHHTAIRIGAGQVIVSGDFVVKDWVTADATTIKGGMIEASTITATQLIKTENLITQSIQIGDALITTVKIDGFAVTEGKIADSAVTAIKIANLAVTNAKVANLAVTTGKIANLAVTTGKIDDLAVTSAKIDTCSVSKLTAGTLTVQELLGTGGSVKTATSGARVEITPGGINIYGGKLTTRAYAGGSIQCKVDAYGQISAGAGAVILNSGGLHIYGAYALFYTDAGDARGGIKGVSDSFTIYSQSGYDLVLYPGTSWIRPPDLTKNLGTSTYYWNKIYAYNYYGKITSISSFQTHDDIKLVKSIKEKRVKQIAEGIETDKEITVLDFDSLPDEIKEEEGFISVPNLTSLALGAIKQMAERLDALEERYQGKEVRVNE